jgi:uncharacterized membrane protein HdeD (DUF308 family)
MTNAGMMMRRIDDVGQHAGWFMTLGVVFIIGGVAALLLPFVASIAAVLTIGWVFILVGFITLIQAWQISTWGGFIWQAIIGLVIFLGGVGAIIDPISAAIGLALLVGIMFLAKGIAQLVMGLNLRPVGGWEWVLCAGILSVLVGLIIVFNWPLSGAWVLGTLAGISFIGTGASYIMMAVAARRIGGAMK